MSYRIKDLPMEEKPREKVKEKGIESLSTPELIAILLRTGSKKESVKDLAIRVYEHLDGLKGFKALRIHNLTSIHGIGETKAITLIAAIELGKRMQFHAQEQKKRIKKTKDVFLYYRDFYYLEEQEKFMAVFLTSNNTVITEKVIFTGTANQSVVHPRDIFKEAILNNAVKILCLHNHPSGNVNPSQADLEFTKKMKEIGNLLGIPLVDHVIIGREAYYSFLEKSGIL